MPKIFDPNLESHTLATSHYGFSAEGINNLGATEYTLVTIAADTSSSVHRFASEIEECLKSILRACRLSPRADNLMIRTVEFNDKISEIHGYTLLDKLKEDDYNGAIRPHGNTALYDASYNAIEAASTYGKHLNDMDYTVNAIVIVLTDGEENSSSIRSAQMIADQVENITRTETLESVVTILIGLNTTPQLNSYLQNFKDDAKFDQYISVQDTNPQSIAKVADFISRSISAQSQSLGTGGPSVTLAF